MLILFYYCVNNSGESSLEMGVETIRSAVLYYPLMSCCVFTKHVPTTYIDISSIQTNKVSLSKVIWHLRINLTLTSSCTYNSTS